MVASEATSSLAALLNTMASLLSAEKLTRMDNRQTSPEKNYSGLDLERESPLRSRRSFFLTSLFIELIDP
jgi:hypothetical protein